MKDRSPGTPKFLALADARLARRWAGRGLLAARHLQDQLQGRPSRSITPKVSRAYAEALTIHFKVHVLASGRRAAAADLGPQLARVRGTFAAVFELLSAPEAIFEDVPPDYEQVHGVAAGAIAYVHLGRVWFTPHYAPSSAARDAGFGSPARAAMVLHEMVHVVDPHSGHPDNHISEWDPRYGAMTAAQSIHNASSYAAFGQHACYLADTRFGAGETTRHAPTPRAAPR
jgi:hypothetical protein